MMLALLTVAGIGIAVTAAYVLTTKQAPVEALAGETTIAASAAAAETIANERHMPERTRTEWQLTTVGGLRDAEELLDVLENQGVAERELVVLGNSCFAVRWR